MYLELVFTRCCNAKTFRQVRHAPLPLSSLYPDNPSCLRSKSKTECAPELAEISQKRSVGVTGAQYMNSHRGRNIPRRFCLRETERWPDTSIAIELALSVHLACRTSKKQADRRGKLGNCPVSHIPLRINSRTINSRKAEMKARSPQDRKSVEPDHDQARGGSGIPVQRNPGPEPEFHRARFGHCGRLAAQKSAPQPEHLQQMRNTRGPDRRAPRSRLRGKTRNRAL